MRNALSKNPQRLTVQCSEPLAAPRSTISMTSALALQPRASLPAVSDLVSR
jgi:hypothetical protein